MFDEKLAVNTIRKQIMVIKSFYRWLRISYREYQLDERYQYDISDGIKSKEKRIGVYKLQGYRILVCVPEGVSLINN